MSDVVSGHIVRVRPLGAGCSVLTVVVPFETGEAKNYAPGRHVALALLEQEFPRIYGEQARILFKSGFFNNPKVLEAIGPESQYNEWVRSRPSVVSKRRGTDSDRIEAAHVRMLSEGAGTARKNKYATIPLLMSEHRAQHDNGYQAIGGKEKLISLLYRHRIEWAKEAIKYQIGFFASFTQIPPLYFIHFCQRRGIEKYIPKEYREAANG